MATKTKTREITIVEEDGAFNAFFKRFTSSSEKEMDFASLSLLRKILSNQKARLLHTVKTQNPKSIYDLAKILKRDFKSVSEDIKLLQRFGFMEMISEQTGKRKRLKPIISADSINIIIKL